VQVQVRAPLGLLAQPVLADQHECREKDRFERDHHREETVRKRIERLESKSAFVNHDPYAEPDDVDIHERCSPRKIRDPVGNAVLKTPVALRLAAEAHDRTDVPLDHVREQRVVFVVVECRLALAGHLMRVRGILGFGGNCGSILLSVPATILATR
jgi:hypothetical protein